jgi:hypothetical protein
LIEIGPLVLEKIFFLIFSVSLLFCYYLPLGKGVPLHLKNLEFPLLKDNLCQNWPSGCGEEVENVKDYRRTDGRRTTGDQKSSLELSAQVTYPPPHQKHPPRVEIGHAE